MVSRLHFMRSRERLFAVAFIFLQLAQVASSDDPCCFSRSRRKGFEGQPD